MDRRHFLIALAAGLAGTAAVRGLEGPAAPGTAPPWLADDGSRRGADGSPRDAAQGEPATQDVAPAGPEAGIGPEMPPSAVVTALPEGGPTLALTIDDGTSTEVVAAFTALAKGTGVRLTFFPNGRYASWTDNAAALRPLVESGQVALGNHTWSHADLTTLSDAEVAEDIARNRDFLREVFGVRDTPFFRPPFGARNERIDRIAADLGHPTVVMWNGTLDDARAVSGRELMAAARHWFAARAIIVGHANQPTVTTVFDELLQLLAERELTTVTLADAWATPEQRVRGASVRAVARIG